MESECQVGIAAWAVECRQQLVLSSAGAHCSAGGVATTTLQLLWALSAVRRSRAVATPPSLNGWDQTERLQRLSSTLSPPRLRSRSRSSAVVRPHLSIDSVNLRDVEADPSAAENAPPPLTPTRLRDSTPTLLSRADGESSAVRIEREVWTSCRCATVLYFNCVSRRSSTVTTLTAGTEYTARLGWSTAAAGGSQSRLYTVSLCTALARPPKESVRFRPCHVQSSWPASAPLHPHHTAVDPSLLLSVPAHRCFLRLLLLRCGGSRCVGRGSVGQPLAGL